MLENGYQAVVIKKLRRLFPGCVIMKNDSGYMQGVPDLTLLWKKHWAVLEVKKSAKEKAQPNQEYYIEQMDRMSFAAFIYPENEEEVLDAIQRAFSTRRTSRVSKSK